MNKLVHAMFMSRLAPETSGTGITEILREVRPDHQRMRITGILIFDGDNFCQYIEGPRKAVTQSLSRFRGDKRHIDLRLLSEGEAAQRRFEDWSLAYWNDQSATLEQLFDLAAGGDPLQRLEQLLPSLDTPPAPL